MTVKAKKFLSQNFLTNTTLQTNVASKLVDLIALREVDILEIGPGRGELTGHLLDLNRDLWAVEVDTEAVEFLQKKFTNYQNFRLVADSAKDIFLKDKDRFFGEMGLPPNFTFVSNLPFHIGSRILVDLPIYFFKNNFGVILQYEVATKMDSKSDPTFFGFWLNLFYQISDIKKISKGNFSPPPKVDCGYVSGITRFLENDTLPDFLSDSKKRLKARQILKQLFSQPRKSILNNLKPTLKKTQLQKIETYLEKNAYTRLTWQNYVEVLETVCILDNLS